ncbi:MAG TPA: hypothetical protein VK196_14730 [Magnetospirillum sp.]|nr:hypothetical protein [Magnetospirillum sp.]
MAEVVLTAISPRDIGGRQVFNTGLSTVGRGGDDYLCGHCGHKMLGDFNMDRMEVDIVFQCGSCGGHNVAPQLEGRVAKPTEGGDA